MFIFLRTYKKHAEDLYSACLYFLFAPPPCLGLVRLDSMFVDEGFGSLDEKALNQALELLATLANDGNRLIGVISHVADLKERIDKKIVVKKAVSGSEIRFEG